MRALAVLCGVVVSGVAGCAKYAPLELSEPVRFAPVIGRPALCASLLPESGRLPKRDADAWSAARAALESGDAEAAWRAVENTSEHPAKESLHVFRDLIIDGAADAIPRIEVLAEDHPNDACVQQFAAVAMLGSSPEAASQYIERAFRLDPGDPDVALLHLVLSTVDAPREAAAQLKVLSAEQPTHPATQVLAGRSLVQMGDVEGATVAFERAYAAGVADVAESLYHLRRMTGRLDAYLLQARELNEPLEPVELGEHPVEDLDRWLGLEKESDRLQVTFETSVGDVACTLYPHHAPVTVVNFVALARGQKPWTDPKDGSETQRPLYDGTLFHRTIPEFMVQGGDPLGTGEGFPGYRFRDELHPSLKFDRPGRLAMANSGEDTNGSQFFITEVATPHLDGRHTIFGQCDDVSVVEAMARVPSDASDRPEADVVLRSVKLAIVPCEDCTH
ncbi:MAG: peptidylprolyl isomerase [Myxococcota bacterium]